MTKFTITTTPKGWFRVETRFQRIGTYKTEAAAQGAIKAEQERLDFIRAATSEAQQTYAGIMAANAKAEQEWMAQK